MIRRRDLQDYLWLILRLSDPLLAIPRDPFLPVAIRDCQPDHPDLVIWQLRGTVVSGQQQIALFEHPRLGSVRLAAGEFLNGLSWRVRSIESGRVVLVSGFPCEINPITLSVQSNEKADSRNSVIGRDAPVEVR